jgi:hypothetical protein
VSGATLLLLVQYIIVELSKPMWTIAVMLAQTYNSSLFERTGGNGLPVGLKLLRVDPKPVDS